MVSSEGGQVSRLGSGGMAADVVAHGPGGRVAGQELIVPEEEWVRRRMTPSLLCTFPCTTYVVGNDWTICETIIYPLQEGAHSNRTLCTWDPVFQGRCNHTGKNTCGKLSTPLENY